MISGKKIHRLFPGSVATSLVIIVLGIVMAVLPLISGMGGLAVAPLLSGLGSAMFIAGFLGLIYVTILAEEFKKITDQPLEQLTLLSKIQHFGLCDIFRNRLEGTEAILSSLRDENKQFIITGTSLKGLVGMALNEEDEYGAFWQELKDALKRKVKVNILLTNPGMAHHRSRQEGRLDGEIEAEIIENLIYLVLFKIENPNLAEYLSIRLYNGTPSIFMMCTSKKMLINPYPYYATAYNSHSFLIEGGSALYTSYYHSHYRSAWLDSGLNVEIAEDPKEVVKQIQEIINQNSHENNKLIIPDEAKRNSLLQILYSILQNKQAGYNVVQ
jgi:hypothetical protein